MKKIEKIVKDKRESDFIRHKGKVGFFKRFTEFWIRSYYETKISIKSESKKQFVKDIIFMILGNVALAFGTQVFIINNELITGGVSGISLIITWLSEGTGLDVNFIITILTWVLFLIGLLLLGLRFAFKTLIATIIFPPLLYLFSMLTKALPWLVLPTDSELSMLLGALFGGAFVGIGCGLTFIGGGSTGGVDCLSIAANKYLHIKTSYAAFFIDATIILVGFIVRKRLDFCLIGIISALIAAVMIDRVYLGHASTYTAFIVSDRGEEISDRINYAMERGTTIYIAEGGYTHNQRKVVQVVFDRKEYRDLKNIIAEIDPKAFVTVMNAHEVNGYGFKKLKKNKMSLKEIIAEDKKKRLEEKDDKNG